MRWRNRRGRCREQERQSVREYYFARSWFCRFDLEADVGGGRRVRERADGNTVDASFGELAHFGKRDSAGGFERGAALGISGARAGDGFAHECRSEIIEQDRVGLLGQSFVEFVERIHFYFEESHRAAIGLRGTDRGRDTAGE